MPIYEYRCQKCGHDLEVMQKISDPAPVKCPSCGEENSFERLMSRSSFQLKGGGWYSDLYSSSKKDGSGTSGTGSPASGSASSTSSAASTPASTTGGTSGGSTGGSSGGTGGTSSGGSGSTGGSSSGGSSGGSGTGGSSARSA